MQHGENSRWIRISYSRSIHTQRGEAKAIEHEMKMGKNSLYSTDIWIGNLCDLMKYMLYSYVYAVNFCPSHEFIHSLTPSFFFSTNKRDPRPSMSNTIQRWWCWWWRRWHTERATMKFYKCTRELLKFFFGRERKLSCESWNSLNFFHHHFLLTQLSFIHGYRRIPESMSELQQRQRAST